MVFLEKVTEFLSPDEVFKEHIDKNVRETDNRGGQEDNTNTMLFSLDFHDVYCIFVSFFNSVMCCGFSHSNQVSFSP